MQQALSASVLVIALAGCAAAPPAAPPAPHPAPVLIAAPVTEVLTPALKQLMAAPADAQVLAGFQVQPDGSIADAHVIFSKLAPADVSTVLDALRQWRFKPAIEHGQPVTRPFIYPLFFGPDAAGQRTRFYCHNQHKLYDSDRGCHILKTSHWRIYQMDPVYPANLLDQHLAGSVTLSFDVNPRGEVQNPKVMSATPPGAFDAAAVAAVQQWYFESLDDPAAAAEQHVTVTVKFTPPAEAKANAVPQP